MFRPELLLDSIKQMTAYCLYADDSELMGPIGRGVPDRDGSMRTYSRGKTRRLRLRLLEMREPDEDI